MASIVRHFLTAANQKLLQPFQSLCAQGCVVRTLSAKCNQPTSLIGSNGSQPGLSANHVLALSALPETGVTAEKGRGGRGSSQILQTLGQSSMGVTLEQSLALLTLSPVEARISAELILPTVNMSGVAQTILDPSPCMSLWQEYPSAIPLLPLYDPISIPTEIHAPTKEGEITKHASNIMYKRRRKMNHHKYLKWKRRNKFKIRIQRQRRKKKKRLKWEQHLDKYRFKGLQPGEGEKIMAKKKAKMAIFLKYLGIKTDEELEAEKEKEKEIRPAYNIGKIVPEPILPKNAKIG